MTFSGCLCTGPSCEFTIHSSQWLQFFLKLIPNEGEGISLEVMSQKSCIANAQIIVPFVDWKPSGFSS